MKTLICITLYFVSLLSFAAIAPTPLNDAARSGDFKTVKKLILNGVDPNELNNYGSSALSGACGNCSDESIKIIKLLYASGAELNPQTPQGLTPIGYASAMNCNNNVKTLLKLGADPEIPANNGWTPLIQAVTNENIIIIEALLDAGVNIDHKNKAGYDAQYVAAKTKNPEIISLLQNYSKLTKKETTTAADVEHLRLKDLNTCGLVDTSGQLINENCPDDIPEKSLDNYGVNFQTIFISFLITWTVILIPPTLIRLTRKQPISKVASVVISTILFFINIVLFIAMGSQSKSHFATVLGAFVCYKILSFRYKTTNKPKLSNEAKVIEQKVNIPSEPKMKKELSRTKKIWIVSSIAWSAWVCFRTFDDYELLGFNLRDWDSDFFFLNLFSIPLLVALFLWSYHWITKSSDASNKQ